MAAKKDKVKTEEKVQLLSRLKEKYQKEIIGKMMKEYKYDSVMQVPKIEKVILNMGVGDAIQEKGVLDSAVEELSTIASQKAVKTYAKKSISNFHLREGMAIGTRVTLRGNRMYHFLDKLISVAIPRVRDFRGLKNTSFDGKGNYSMAFREQLVFPEINYDKIKKIRGMDVTIVTTSRNDEEAYTLLKLLGMPLKEK